MFMNFHVKTALTKGLVPPTPHPVLKLVSFNKKTTQLLYCRIVVAERNGVGGWGGGGGGGGTSVPNCK